VNRLIAFKNIGFTWPVLKFIGRIQILTSSYEFAFAFKQVGTLWLTKKSVAMWHITVLISQRCQMVF